MSGEAAKEGLSTTLFERMIKMYGETVTRKLVIQYRMNETIMQWSSKVQLAFQGIYLFCIF